MLELKVALMSLLGPERSAPASRLASAWWYQVPANGAPEKSRCTVVGPALSSPGVTGDVVLVNDGVGTLTDGCEAFAGVAGKVALIDRGTCTFVIKVKNAQNAGAIGVIVADNVAGCPPSGMGGSDATITIPSVRITQADGATLKASLAGGPVNVTLRVIPPVLAGADAAGRVLMYTPSTYSSGSSVSHWDVSATPDLLMEPALSNSLSSNPDLAFALFADIGWFQGFAGVPGGAAPVTRLGSSVPNPAADAATIHYTLAREQRVEISIFDPGGRLVTRLVEGRMPAGEHSVRWDGTDRSGRAAPPGVYLYRLQSSQGSEARHLVRVR